MLQNVMELVMKIYSASIKWQYNIDCCLGGRRFCNIVWELVVVPQLYMITIICHLKNVKRMQIVHIILLPISIMYIHNYDSHLLV